MPETLLRETPHPSPAAPKSLRTAVAGVGGYSGAELARLLLHHPRLREKTPLFLGRPDDGTPSAGAISLTSLHPQLAGSPGADEARILPLDWKLLEGEGIEVLFLATPHEQSREWAPEALDRGLRVIDLSGAWRLHHHANRAVYKLQDADPDRAATLQAEAVYGLPELHRARISPQLESEPGSQLKSQPRLVANPGCYATSVILALAPLLLGDLPGANLVDLAHGIVCDAKSGVSGAGKAPTSTTHFMYAADNLSAYNVFGHRHRGELYEQLHLSADQIQFTPHLLPIPRGILTTIYLRLSQPSTLHALQSIFDGFYAASPLVRVRRSPALPQIQHVVRSNFCDLGFELAPDGLRLVIVSCLDNLLKGAASQAVQNLNLMAGWPEAEGLL